MKPLEIKKGIYWVGVIDWNVRTFHGHTYSTPRGTTYNAYLIVDEKIALVDTVYGPFAGEMIERIREIVEPGKIDYIIVNHVETDHSGALPAITKLCPGAKLFGTEKCKEGLYRNYYENWDFCVVKTGDKLKLGKRTLGFLEAAMIHWPDSMFTYCAEEKLLLSNDAFGQHLASSKLFDDEVDECVLMDEAEKYYTNILWPFSMIILRKIEEIQKMNIAIDIIAPSHGILWRKDPAKIINAYVSWAKNETTKPKAVIIYETMWQSTAKMAYEIAAGLISSGVETAVFDIALSDRTEVIKQMFNAKGFIFGSSTHDNDMLPVMAGFLKFLKGLKPKNRRAAVFGSYGWAGGAVKNIEELLKESGIEVSVPSISVKYRPDKNELTRCFDFGKEFAKKISS
ncbi:MAG: flavodoxin domain-containing protein [Candidatus Omnitrophota bacterium]